MGMIRIINTAFTASAGSTRVGGTMGGICDSSTDGASAVPTRDDNSTEVTFVRSIEPRQLELLGNSRTMSGGLKSPA